MRCGVVRCGAAWRGFGAVRRGAVRCGAEGVRILRGMYSILTTKAYSSAKPLVSSFTPIIVITLNF